MSNAARLREQAVEAARLGQVERAIDLHERAVAAAPKDASILNSAAVFLSRHGQSDRGIEMLQRAVALTPAAAEPLFNLALILTPAGRPREALDLLAEREQMHGGVARYWSVRAGAERALGAKRAALASFSQAATLDPANARTLHGKARMSLETGLAAADQYRAALAANPADHEAWLGLAQALDAEQRSDEAHALLDGLIAQAPDWIEPLELLTQLRWAGGEREQFTNHYAAAAARSANPQIRASWCRTLVGLDLHEEAGQVAAQAQRELGPDAQFALIEASGLSIAGDQAAADRIFDGLATDTPGRTLHEMRHRLRNGDPAEADRLAGHALEGDPDDVTVWALRDLAWRLMDDPRHEWLHGQLGLILSAPLPLGNADLPELIDYLDRLHDASAAPAGQSVRDGTQTRGGLFDRHEPAAHRIEQAFRAAMEIFRSGLPPFDQAHPMLKHRDAPWAIAGSWSVRLLGAGHHVPHIHPRGLISSAAYFAVPAEVEGAHDDQAGWLELGRPPADLRLDLPALVTIEPRVGMCALFPSTLYHGTRAFAAGKRMSAAIDINLGRVE